MKIFHSEYRAEYSSYTFSYAVYCIRENQAELPDIYARGFLPYTGRLDLESEVFYLARSLRVDLTQFADTSENRRVDRKVAVLQPDMEVIARRDFPTGDPEFRAFCIRYAQERFQGCAMDAARLEYVLDRETLTHIVRFRSRDTLLGYVFLALESPAAHYWYAFYDTSQLASVPLGKWMMWRTLHWAKNQGCRFVYLGTCYTRKALYKARDHNGIEFFDGQDWNTDRKLLAHLCERDEGPLTGPDLFKSHDLSIPPALRLVNPG